MNKLILFALLGLVIIPIHQASAIFVPVYVYVPPPPPMIDWSNQKVFEVLVHQNMINQQNNCYIYHIYNKADIATVDQACGKPLNFTSYYVDTTTKDIFGNPKSASFHNHKP